MTSGQSMRRPLTVSLAQIAPTPFSAGALDESVDAVRQAFREGADVVVLPELVVPGYGLDPQRLGATAEEITGPVVRAWQEQAETYDGVVVGGFAECAGAHLFNTAVAVNAEGVLLHYRKLHPFSNERTVFSPGDLGLPVISTRWGRLGLCVCYDLRFVETLRVLSLRGAELVCVPTAWVGGFDEPIRDGSHPPPQALGALLQSNLNQVYLACASQGGREERPELLGGSLLAGPWGEARVGPLPQEVTGVVTVTIDLDDVEDSKQRGPLISPREDRRTDVYALLVGDERL